jgi:hypothetical protein
MAHLSHDEITIPCDDKKTLALGLSNSAPRGTFHLGQRLPQLMRGSTSPYNQGCHKPADEQLASP